jgi:hypothetical protein
MIKWNYIGIDLIHIEKSFQDEKALYRDDVSCPCASIKGPFKKKECCSPIACSYNF